MRVSTTSPARVSRRRLGAPRLGCWRYREYLRLARL